MKTQMNIPVKQIEYIQIYDDQFVSKSPSGTIYNAIHADTSQPLIVKVIRKDRSVQDPSFFDNLKREKFLIQTIKSKNIFPYLDFLETESSFYLVTEHTSGLSLKDFIKNQTPMNEATILRYFLQILNGYSEFYKLNTSHMNISPNTVHYDLTDKTLKLTPFYFAKSSQFKKHINPLNGFMAPEFLLKPETALNCACDVWSLGAVLFFIAFKENPIKGEDIKEIIFNMDLLLNDLVGHSIKSDNRKFSIEFKNFIEGFLKKTPEARLKFDQMITHPCLLNHKEAFEKFLISTVKAKYGKIKGENNKYPPEILTILSSMVENNNSIFKGKNLKTLEKFDSELAEACNFLRLYNECSPKFLGNWIEASTNPRLHPHSAAIDLKPSSVVFNKPNLLQRGATIGDIPVIDEEEEAEISSPKHKIEKKKIEMRDRRKTMQPISNKLGSLIKTEDEGDNMDLSEKDAIKAIIPKYFNELDSFNYYFEIFLQLKDIEKDFKEEVLLVRFAIMKFLIFRYQLFEKKLTEKENIFALPFWTEIMIKTKDYNKILEILLAKRQEKEKWNQIYADLGEETEKMMIKICKNRELKENFTDGEKHFLEREVSLNRILFSANDFKLALQGIFIKLLKSIRVKDEELKKAKAKQNQNFYKIGIQILKLIEITNFLGFDKFDIKSKYVFRNMRQNFTDIKSDFIELTFMKEIEGLMKKLPIKLKK